jgi:hypothetical protein
MKNILRIVILSRLLLLAIGVIVFLKFPFSLPSYTGNFHFPQQESRYVLPFKTWDAQHYLFLADNGYITGQESNRFFPLYPAFIFALTIFIRNSLISSYILSVIFCFGSVVTLFKLTEKLFPKRNISLLAVLLFLAFPTAFYLTLPYTESLFIFLCLQFFYRMEMKKFRTALLFLLLIPLTRPTGIFIILPCLFYLANNPPTRYITLPTFNKPIKIPFVKNIFLIIAPLLGISLYFLFHRIVLGGAFEGLNGINSIASWNPINILDPGSLIRNLISVKLQWHGFQNSLLDRAFFIFFLGMLPIIYKKMPRQYFYFALVMGLVPLLGSFTSYMRYLLPVFPIYIVLADLLAKQKLLILRIVVFAVFFALQVLLFAMHILNYWVS